MNSLNPVAVTPWLGMDTGVRTMMLSRCCLNLDNEWPESEEKYSERCNCEDVTKKEDVNVQGAKKKRLMSSEDVKR